MYLKVRPGEARHTRWGNKKKDGARWRLVLIAFPSSLNKDVEDGWMDGVKHVKRNDPRLLKKKENKRQRGRSIAIQSL